MFVGCCFLSVYGLKKRSRPELSAFIYLFIPMFLPILNYSAYGLDDVK